MTAIVDQGSAFIARFPVKTERKEDFVALFDRLREQAGEFLEAQCHFIFYGWDRAGTSFVAIESYKDEEALAGLRESDLFRQYVGMLMDMCDGDMDIELFSGVHADGSIFSSYPAGPSRVHPVSDGKGARFR